VGLYRVCFRYTHFDYDDNGCVYEIDDEYEDVIRARTTNDIFAMSDAELSKLVGVPVLNFVIIEIEEVWDDERTD